ncbi:hypothetical protein DS745_19040 [Anaerobacillus alkaliphilus]|uniref:Type 4 fimbrial biogenesis protein PilX N-terminal domain-containing protein n=1 Tax=Anaerobacillus alkaliphilus TaxID=1548597 RepID=A0A4Q0VPL2_9BACI|nr:hypothetical protein [Anaerobacillus alkaliphilus]RXI98422.1 hypothetical protein DS745_19040 [Anaerobacillus alkaliphilus]
MINNERGSALLLVLLMCVVLTVLGLAILGNTLNDAKQTSYREEDIVTIHEAQKSIEEALALIKVTFDYKGEIIPLREHNQITDDFLAPFKVEDFTYNGSPSSYVIYIPEDTPFDRNRDFSREFVILTRAKNSNGRIVEFSQKVYLSAIPSFLYYAIGSSKTLNFNGASTILGHVYARNSLVIRDVADYIYSGPQSIDTAFPYIKGEVVIDQPNKKFVFKNNEYLLTPTTAAYYNAESESQIEIGEIDFFNDVDVEKTFVDKYNDIALTNLQHPDHIPYTNPTGGFEEFTITIENAEDVNFNQLIEDNCNLYNKCSLIINIEDGDSYTLGKDLTVPMGHWVVINGDLLIQPDDPSNGLTVDGNLLVNGNVTIIGQNLKFDSTIFARGKAFIYSANIQKKDETQHSLILFSNNGLEVTRINEFDQYTSENEINAFLYTASDATLYGVGSKVKINGGIFAEGDLFVNAVRGEVEKNSSTIEYLPGQIDQKSLGKETSRFYVNHTPEILTPAYSSSKAYNGLPRTTSFNILLDRREFNRK